MPTTNRPAANESAANESEIGPAPAPTPPGVPPKRLCAATTEAGTPCPVRAQANSPYCNIHAAKFARLEQESLAVPPAVLAAAGEGTDLSDTDAPIDESPAARQATADHSTGGDVPPGHVKRAVLDPKTRDYVVKVMTEDEAARLDNPRDPRADGDFSSLGPAYHQGDNALFEYRWGNASDRQNRVDLQNGFVPAKALDNRLPTKDGVPVNGDLILMRRPKEVGAQRAREQAHHDARLLGREVEEFHEEAARLGAESLGGITESRGAYPQEEEADRRPQATRGRSSYFFPNNPLGRDRVAERHRS